MQMASCKVSCMVHAIMPGGSRELDVAKPVGGKTKKNGLVRSVDGDEVGMGAGFRVGYWYSMNTCLRLLLPYS